MDNALYLAKKIFGELLMPVPITLLLLIWSLLFLLRRKTRWLGFLCVLLATALLFAASYAPLSSWTIAPLEQQYASYQPGAVPIDYVSVLGSSHVSAANQPLTSEIKSDGVIRLTEGIRIYRLNPGSKLIFTGYNGSPSDPIAYPDKIKQLALALGVPEEDILTLSGPKDTAEEAHMIAETFPGASLVLVSSATHLPRAMQLFRSAGLEPIPAPTDHRSSPVLSKLQIPSAQTLKDTSIWLHEQLGVTWSTLIGQIKQKKNE